MAAYKVRRLCLFRVVTWWRCQTVVNHYRLLLCCRLHVSSYINKKNNDSVPRTRAVSAHSVAIPWFVVRWDYRRVVGCRRGFRRVVSYMAGMSKGGGVVIAHLPSRVMSVSLCSCYGPHSSHIPLSASRFCVVGWLVSGWCSLHPSSSSGTVVWRSS
jgi:hypothetical protein